MEIAAEPVSPWLPTLKVKEACLIEPNGSHIHTVNLSYQGIHKSMSSLFKDNHFFKSNVFDSLSGLTIFPST